MNSVSRIVILSILLLACRPYIDMKQEILSIENAVGSLCQAVEDDDDQLLAMTFAHDAGMTCIGIDHQDFLVGWDALKSYFIEKRKTIDGIEILTRSLDVKLYERGGLAWASALVDAVVQGEGVTTEIRDLRFTAVFEKRVGRWMIVQAHLSAPVPSDTPFNVQRMRRE